MVNKLRCQFASQVNFLFIPQQIHLRSKFTIVQSLTQCKQKAPLKNEAFVFEVLNILIIYIRCFITNIPGKTETEGVI